MKMTHTRRAFLRQLLVASGVVALPALPAKLFAQSNYQGKFLLTLQLDGGVDATSFCDPKTNVGGGTPEINRWARTEQVRTAGNLRYAPYAANAAFFDKYYRQMLVINGVDSQTNSHTVGVVHSWSGRNSEGFPSLTALFAAVHQPQLPMAYLNFGGFGDTRSITRSTRVSSTNALNDLVLPNHNSSRQPYLPQSDLDRILALHAQQNQTAITAGATLAGNRSNRQIYLDSLSKVKDIGVFADYIPASNKLQPVRQVTTNFSSTLHQQIQVALLAFKAGMSVSADLFEGGFDTHSRHDTDHPPILSNATNAIDYLWTYAEELGLANRIVLVVGSDFGRTPFFNGSDGKDHWPIGSTIVMEKNAAYANRMVGKTDEGHNALKINPTTLEQDNSSGVIIKPAHVHKALRSYLGLEASAITQRFAFANTEQFRFFG
jgi:hypothetical protein